MPLDCYHSPDSLRGLLYRIVFISGLITNLLSQIWFRKYGRLSELPQVLRRGPYIRIRGRGYGDGWALSKP